MHLTFSSDCQNILSELTGAAEGPAPSMEVHQASPQVTLPSGRGLINSHRDAVKSDVSDFHSWQNPPVRPGIHRTFEALTGLSDGRDVVVEAQPILQGGLRTETEGSFTS